MNACTKRLFSTHGLKHKIKELIPLKKSQLNKIKKDHGHRIIDTVTIDQTLGGMRGVKSLFWNTSLLDTHKGITFHGKSIPELQECLPSFTSNGMPMMESMFYYLLTGHVPSKTEAHELSQEFKQRSLLTETQYICYVHYPKT